MAALICNLPSVEVWVRKEYLTDHQSGHGEFVKGVWVSAKSIPGRTFYFETYLPEYAAMYDKLPISAFVSEPELPTPDMDLPNLQFWNTVWTMVWYQLRSNSLVQWIMNCIQGTLAFRRAPMYVL
tara:strand:- start:77 stop:451 length:375 start_codon:yes stop_codon:yes gene_type:complete